jgi:hypothetical protein
MLLLFSSFLSSLKKQETNQLEDFSSNNSKAFQAIRKLFFLLLFSSGTIFHSPCIDGGENLLCKQVRRRMVIDR